MGGLKEGVERGKVYRKGSTRRSFLGQVLFLQLACPAASFTFYTTLTEKNTEQVGGYRQPKGRGRASLVVFPAGPGDAGGETIGTVTRKEGGWDCPPLRGQRTQEVDVEEESEKPQQFLLVEKVGTALLKTAYKIAHRVRM